MIRWTGLVPWEFEFPFPGSLTSTFLVRPGLNVFNEELRLNEAELEPALWIQLRCEPHDNAAGVFLGGPGGNVVVCHFHTTILPDNTTGVPCS